MKMRFYIFLKCLDSRTFVLHNENLSPYTSVKNLRKMVCEKTGVTEDKQILMLGIK